MKKELSHQGNCEPDEKYECTVCEKMYTADEMISEGDEEICINCYAGQKDYEWECEKDRRLRASS